MISQALESLVLRILCPRGRPVVASTAWGHGSAIRSGLREKLQKQLFDVIGNMNLGPLLLHKRSQKTPENGVFLMVQ